MNINNDSAVMRAVRTLLQVVVGLVLAVWAVPGVPQTVHIYLTGHAVLVLVAVGVPTSAVAFIWGLLRKDVPLL